MLVGLLFGASPIGWKFGDILPARLNAREPVVLEPRCNLPIKSLELRFGVTGEAPPDRAESRENKNH